MRILFEIVARNAERPGARVIHRAAADWRGLKFQVPPREPSDDADWERILLDVGRETTAVLIAGAPDAPGREELLAGLVGPTDAVAAARAGGTSYTIGLNREEADYGLYLGVGLVACAVARLTDGVLVDWVAGVAQDEASARASFDPARFDPARHIAIRGTPEDEGGDDDDADAPFQLRSRGMAKLGLPDLELPGVPKPLLGPASELLATACRYTVSAPVAPGESILLGPVLLTLLATDDAAVAKLVDPPLDGAPPDGPTTTAAAMRELAELVRSPDAE